MLDCTELTHAVYTNYTALALRFMLTGVAWYVFAQIGTPHCIFTTFRIPYFDFNGYLFIALLAILSLTFPSALSSLQVFVFVDFEQDPINFI